jgi:hypothetical protein
MGVGPHYITPLQIPMSVMSGSASAPASPAYVYYHQSPSFSASSGGVEAVSASPLPVAFTTFQTPSAVYGPPVSYSPFGAGMNVVGVPYPLEYQMQNLSLHEISPTIMMPSYVPSNSLQ